MGDALQTFTKKGLREIKQDLEKMWASSSVQLLNHVRLCTSRRVLFKDDDAKTYLCAVGETHCFSQLQMVGWR